MTPEMLRIIIQLLWGERAYVPAADALGINERSLRRWANGTNPIPPMLPAQLDAAARALAGGARSRNVQAALRLLAEIQDN